MGTAAARTLVSPANARATQAISITAPPPEACEALAQMGDAVALIDRRARKLRWTSSAWLKLLPETGAGVSLEALEQDGVGLHLGVGDFDRHRAAVAQVCGAEQGSHSAAGRSLVKAVMVQNLAFCAHEVLSPLWHGGAVGQSHR